jgi:predicted permease
MNNYTDEESEAFHRELLEQLPTLPGVEFASTATRMPLAPDVRMTGVFVPGVHQTEDDAEPIYATTVGEDYFQVTGIPILRGRAFDDDIDVEGALSVAIVNETMAEQYWPGKDPIGERIYQDGPDGEPTEIVGVARDHKVQSLGEEPRPYIHFPQSQTSSAGMVGLIVRTSGPAEAMLPMLRSEILAMEPEIVFADEGTASEVVELTLAPARLGARLLGAFGGLALLLAAVGLYGVIAYAVSRRTHEVGLRMALGASAPSVLSMILRQGMVLAVIGVGVGAVLAALVARVLQSLLYGVSSVDPVSYAIAALVLLIVALAANLVPAWRASRTSPMAALRYE